jgi:hypothetical protein
MRLTHFAAATSKTITLTGCFLWLATSPLKGQRVYARFPSSAAIAQMSHPIADLRADSTQAPSTGQRFAMALVGGVVLTAVAVSIDGENPVGLLAYPVGAVTGVGLANRKIYQRWDVRPAVLGMAIGSFPIVLAVASCAQPGAEKDLCGLVAVPAVITVPLGAALAYRMRMFRDRGPR